jgi:hypothetical protein
MVANSICLELHLCDDDDSLKVMWCGNHDDDDVVSEAGVRWICCKDVTVAKDGYVA